MPYPYFRTETDMMKKDAISMMQEDRNKNKLSRSIKRSWDYKDGKKKAIKLGVTAGLTTAFVVVGVATHGAGVAVIAGLAAGSYVVGKMSDTAFAKLYGREYTGATRTREFIQNLKGNQVDFDTEEHSKSLSSRAHKTIRRACQHYRTAFKKLVEFEAEFTAKTHVTTCDEAAERITALLQIKRHLDKSRLYIHPAFFLSGALFNFYSNYWHIWNGTHSNKKVEDRLGEQIVQLMMDHHKNGGACGSEECYYELGKQPANWQNPAITNEPLWNDHDLDHRKHALEEAKEHLELDPTIAVPSVDRNLNADAGALYADTKAKYLHRSVFTKVKHSVTNTWDRKTTGEKWAFGISQAVSAGVAAGGTGGGLQIPEALREGLEVAIKYGEEALSQGAEAGLDAAAEASGGGPAATGSAKSAKEGQETLQKAAVHLWEVIRVQEKLDALRAKKLDPADTNVCGFAMEKLYEIYRLKHHLYKTQLYLSEAIEMVEKCSTELNRKIKSLKEWHNEIVIDINQFMRTGNHAACKNCYKGSGAAQYVVDL